jgi:hypothetical protein
VSESCSLKLTNTCIEYVQLLLINPGSKKFCGLPKQGQRPTSNTRQICSTQWTQAAAISESV